MMTIRTILNLAALSFLIVGCSYNRTGIPYKLAEQRIDKALISRVDDKPWGAKVYSISRYSKIRNVDRSGWLFDERQGNRKLELISPKRVMVRLYPTDSGNNSILSVHAQRRGLFSGTMHRNKSTEKVWYGIIEEIIRGQ